MCGRPPVRYVPSTTTAVTPTPAATTWTRCRQAMNRASRTAAGHTLIHVATLRSTEPSTGRSDAYRSPISTIGAAMPSTRAKLR
ncbi:Uncharacterised protein [Kocuria rosea]|nr:Uncharacterised protein [Kocuria rosea]